MLEIDQNEELAIAMLMQPTFSVDKVAHEKEKEQVLALLTSLIENPRKPIAQQWWRHVHRFKLFLRKNKKRIRTKFKMQ